MDEEIFKNVSYSRRYVNNILLLSKGYMKDYNIAKEEVYKRFKDNDQIEKNIEFYEFFKEFLTEKERVLYLNEKPYVRNTSLIKNKFLRMINKEEEEGIKKDV